MQKILKQYALPIWLLLILIAGFLVVLLTGYMTSRDALRRNLSEQALPMTGDRIYSEIQKDILRPVIISSQMAHDTFFRDSIVDGEQDSAAIIKQLKDIKSKNHASSSFLVSDLTRQYYKADGAAKTVSENDPRDQWYFSLRKQKIPYETHVDQDMSSQDTLRVFINYRMQDQSGKFIGSTGVGLALDNLKRLIDAYQSRFARKIYFIDGKGDVMLGTTKTARSQQNILKLTGISNIAPQILANKKNESQAFEYNTKTENIILNARFIPELGWYLLVEQELGSELKPLQDMLMINAAIGATIALIVLALLLIYVRRYQRRMDESAATDQLTSLLNRQAFDFVFQHALLDSERSRQTMCVALVDIDFFKKLNDKQGHLVGDHVLREIALIAKRSLRESDVICRWGGEEFLILLKNCSLEKATSIAENLRSTIAGNDFSRTTDLARKRLSVTVSMGVAQCKDKETEDSVFERAEVALDQAKENGRNSVYFSE
jgi:diguanylate cyclase (GGDEF)-like protein